MSAPISVIILTLNSAPQLQRCLGPLADAITEGLLAEVIFADGGSTDDTAEIAEGVGAVFLSAPKGRGRQMAAAADIARGEWLLFLHSDSVLGRDWQDSVTRHLPKTDKAAYFKLRFDEDSVAARWLAGWANFRSRAFGLPYGDQGLLISRKLYNSVGGFRKISLMEDVAMAKSLKGKLSPLTVIIETSAGKFRRDGWIKRSLTNFWVLVRYWAGADPEVLAARYYR